ncbi:MAG: GspH/FimT family pseudopilin [Sulfuricaulis sp.]|uniref:GspH/FimT family pseudopilin n=1 Tax=Sulfuricaulis sp. TaxID=2003553 RepID=UPI0025E51102|nr:GspH/FimT family pseudopilin [Sulfuricaulis sp.]MCR4346809.1 GspH/FimT family pseudopilin [Sulfuricaulis sp.]
MHNRYLKLGKASQNETPSVCRLMPFIGIKNPVVSPLVGQKLPFICNRGFTLVELIIVLTIAGVLMALAAPGMQNFVASNRLTAQVNDLLGDINIARSEAIKRNTSAGICVTAVGGSTCTVAGNWANGWLVYYVDPDTAASVAIKIHEKFSGNNTLTAPTDALVFNKSGFLTTAAGDFTLCDSKLGKSRLVQVIITGRPALTEGTCP